MAIDKALNQAPLGLDGTLSSGVMKGVNAPQEDFEIEIDLGDDDEPESEEDQAKEDEFNENLAEDMDEGQLTELVGDLLGELDEDKIGRAHV